MILIWVHPLGVLIEDSKSNLIWVFEGRFLMKTLLIGVCILIITLLGLLMSVFAYDAGFQSAVKAATPYIEDDHIVIDFDGELHLYE